VPGGHAVGDSEDLFVVVVVVVVVAISMLET
jgi:hypothetical protein